MADIAYTRLRQDLFRIHETYADRDGLKNLTRCLGDAWSVLDNIHRVHEVADKFPGLKKRQQSPHWRRFDERCRSVEVLRNVVQHLNSHIAKMQDKTWPIWGVLSWCVLSPDQTSIKTYTYIPGRTSTGSRPLLNPLGGAIQELPVGMITMTIEETNVCLGDLMEDLKILIRSLEASFADLAQQSSARDGSDWVTCMEIGLSDAAPEQNEVS